MRTSIGWPSKGTVVAKGLLDVRVDFRYFSFRIGNDNGIGRELEQ